MKGHRGRVFGPIMRRLWLSHVNSKWLARLVLIPLWWCFDRVCTKHADHWAFFVHPLKNDQFVENSRAVFEAVKDDDSIHKIIFTRGEASLEIRPTATVRMLNLQSLAGLRALSTCGVYLITNALALDISWRWPDESFQLLRPSRRRAVVNLWHGIALKRLFAVANPEIRSRADRVAYRRAERAHYAGLVASSDVDSYAMAAAFHPLAYSQIWITGLPRSDFLGMPYVKLPGFLASEVDHIRELKGGRRMVTYAPTFRDPAIQGASCYQFTRTDIDRLKALLTRHNAVFGFRMHYFRKGDRLFNMGDFIDGRQIVDLGHDIINEIAPVIRETDLLITDYSSVYIDAIYLNKPVFSFAYDLSHYQTQQNGLLYDMKLAFPGPVVGDFESLLHALDVELSRPAQTSNPAYQMAQRLFFNHTDDQNSKRLVERIKSVVGDAPK